MPRTPITAAVLLLALASIAAAHGDEASNPMAEDVGRPVVAHEYHDARDTSTKPESYSQLHKLGGIMLLHVVLMTIAWVVVLPIGVLLSVARSRRSVLVQFLFLIINAAGLVFGTIYNTSTEDLYPNNAHHELGWVLAWMTAAQGFMALVNTCGGRWEATKNQEREEELAAFIPVSTEAMAEHHRLDRLRSGVPYNNHRLSGDSGQGTEPNTESLYSHSASPSHEQPPFSLPELRHEFEEQQSEKQREHVSHSRLDQYRSRKVSGLSQFRILTFFDVLYNVVDRVILILAFAAYTTGLVTWSGIHEGNSVFNGLAHFIKGGIFFWYGILTLGRWAGCFADLGWAWNVKPDRTLVGKPKENAPTAEFVESFLFFLYGSTNVFLEHLAAWGSEWTAIDMEHLAITILAMGGGLLGMLIESTKIRTLLNNSAMDFNHRSSSTHDLCRRTQKDTTITPPFHPPKSYTTSTNPVPALILTTLGLTMSSHTQANPTSTAIHKQWGTLLVIAALARALTYIMYYLHPPTSYLPGRPPTEVVTAFGLMAGGLLFMCSSRDVVGIMVARGVGAMVVMVVVLGGVFLIMGWVVGGLAVRGWVLAGERPGRNTVRVAGGEDGFDEDAEEVA